MRIEAVSPGRTRSKLSDLATTELEKRILEGEFPPGSRLPLEWQLCELLGVSRTVVRECVRTLSAKGLVTVHQGRGTIVAQPSDANLTQALALFLQRTELTIGDLVDARSTIELALAPVIMTRHQDADVTAISSNLRVFTTAVSEHDWEQAYSSHIDFHLALIAAVHMPALEILLKPLDQFIIVSSLPPEGDNADVWGVADHARILDALTAGDQESFRREVAEHFSAMRGPAYSEFRSTLIREARRFSPSS